MTYCALYRIYYVQFSCPAHRQHGDRHVMCHQMFGNCSDTHTGHVPIRCHNMFSSMHCVLVGSKIFIESNRTNNCSTNLGSRMTWRKMGIITHPSPPPSPRSSNHPQSGRPLSKNHFLLQLDSFFFPEKRGEYNNNKRA